MLRDADGEGGLKGLFLEFSSHSSRPSTSQLDNFHQLILESISTKMSWLTSVSWVPIIKMQKSFRFWKMKMKLIENPGTYNLELIQVS